MADKWDQIRRKNDLTPSQRDWSIDQITWNYSKFPPNTANLKNSTVSLEFNEGEVNEFWLNPKPKVLSGRGAESTQSFAFYIISLVGIEK